MILIDQTTEEKGRHKIAKIRHRVLAFIIDFLIFAIIAYIVGIFYGTPNEDGGHSINGWPAFLLFLLGFFLWPISEWLCGQTIGKRATDLKVVNSDYNSISLGQALGRFFIGFFDYIFLIGIIVAVTNKQNKRLGDIASNTLVLQVK